jgi:hypothetical protein
MHKMSDQFDNNNINIELEIAKVEEASSQNDPATVDEYQKRIHVVNKKPQN